MTPATLSLRLHAHLERCASLRFSWRDWTCADFAAAWVLQATGRGVAIGLPLQAAARGWVAALRQAGGMRVHASRQLRTAWRPACLAATGDVVMLPGRVVGEALGVCVGDRIACVGSPGGVAWQSLHAALACWPLADIAAAGAAA